MHAWIPRRTDGIRPDRNARRGSGYGRSHLRASIGLRIIDDFIECRDALDYRLLFQRDEGPLVFRFYGIHDEVRVFLKNRR